MPYEKMQWCKGCGGYRWPRDDRPAHCRTCRLPFAGQPTIDQSVESTMDAIRYVGLTDAQARLITEDAPYGFDLEVAATAVGYDSMPVRQQVEWLYHHGYDPARMVAAVEDHLVP